MSNLIFLEPGATFGLPKVVEPHYTKADIGKALPADEAEPVWVDHPMLAACQIFQGLLVAFMMDVPAGAMGDNAERIERANKTRSWIDGQNPISQDVVETLIRLRSRIAKEDGITSLPPAREVRHS